MKKHFPGYYPLYLSQQKEIFEKCIVVIDTDALLDLYRIRKESAESILSILEHHRIKEKLWMPFDIAWLYHQKLNAEILGQIDFVKNALSHLTVCNDIVSSTKKYPYLDDTLSQELKRVIDDVSHSCDKQLCSLVESLKKSDVKNRINNLFDSKIGDEYEEEELKVIYEEGKKRYTQLQPPGYASDRNAMERINYHDLIVWKQLLKYAEDKKKSVVLVTGNVRRDWYYIIKNEIISPRQELVDEFMSKTKTYFYSFSLKSFLEFISAHLKIKESNLQTILEELKENVDYASVDGNYISNNQGENIINSI